MEPGNDIKTTGIDEYRVKIKPCPLSSFFGHVADAIIIYLLKTRVTERVILTDYYDRPRRRLQSSDGQLYRLSNSRHATAEIILSFFGFCMRRL